MKSQFNATNRLAIILLLLLSFPLKAQFDKLTVYAGGMATYSYHNNIDLTGDSKNTRHNSLSNIGVGIFPIKKLLVGLNFGLIYSSERAENVMIGTSVYPELEEKSSSYTVGPFVRYYIFKGLYGETSYFFGKSKSTSKYMALSGNPDQPVIIQGTEEIEQGIRGISIGTGYSLFLDRNKKIALDIGVSYQNYKAASKYSGVAAGLGISGFIF